MKPLNVELASGFVLLGTALAAGVLLAGWLGFLVAVGIHVARWFL